MNTVNEANFEAGIINNLKYDVPAGLVVFLVALPLCLGIALASGAPLFSGVIAGIVGGLVISFLSGSEVSVSGPAAGLTVIVAGAIQSLGSFEVFLAAVALSGLIQIALGYLRAGVIGDYVPSCVIKGMLAAIGVVIILKQIPHALGYDANYEGDFDFFKAGENNTLTEIIRAVITFSPAAVAISAVSLAVLILWERPAVKGNKILKLVPGALVVVALGILMNEGFRAFAPHLALRGEDGHLVSLPVAEGLGGFFRQFTFPDWGALANKQVYVAALTIAVIGSIESLLSVEAGDKLDRFRRISSTNRELKAQGVGNLISGLIGGLPVTAVIVRTSANVYAGSRTRFSSFVHGALLFSSVLLIPQALNRLPLASLAVVLFVVGYKLTRVELYRAMYRTGVDQFLPFMTTVAAIVFTDLLTGILIGMVVGILFIIKTNHHSAITVVNQDDYYLMRFNKDVSFVNKSALKGMLAAIPSGATLIIDGTKAIFIDKDIYDVVADFEKSARHRGIKIEFKNFHSKAQTLGRLGMRKDGRLQEAVAR